jgi:hypothetical protein
MIEDGQTSSDTKSLFDLCPGEKKIICDYVKKHTLCLQECK